MRIDIPHPWPRTEADAIAIQDRLRALVDRAGPGPQDPRLVAGLDVAYAEGSDRVAAAVVVLDARTLEVVERATAVGEATFPYVPGLFAFRELPVLVEALSRLQTVPELLLCDGQGLAHPRRFGLACHLGVLTGIPAAGVAKTTFVGGYDAAALDPRRGAGAPLVDAGETVGRALRTRDGVKPVYVSTGHGIDLDTACRHVLALAPKYRLPQTTRLADRLSRDVLRAHATG
ncbi:endonuclease V [Streptantibioticus rubrisoli]|uniref:Endonuclease V n=1 Tax=Streptantibioticus rubrisoli TaxID=1387313 RepID=A0ABT1PGA9_9ACTN|nr:endonuclease V [Streptantibioticus rubrisoli]MCQ4044390.1 endonuclease V [Streptantibioticus rubrisoli]